MSPRATTSTRARTRDPQALRQNLRPLHRPRLLPLAVPRPRRLAAVGLEVGPHESTGFPAREGGALTPFLASERVTLYCDRAENVYPELEPGFTLAVLDGPYGMGKGEWDRMGIEGLAAWYAPHLAAVTRLMAPSASLYLWNTAEGWARLDPVVRGEGWEFRTLITWDKVHSLGRLAGVVGWQDVSEFCGLYLRGDPFNSGEETNVWRLSNTGNPACSPASMTSERIFTGEYFTSARAGSRVPLHPCQKPLLFADRMIRASSRPGDRVLVPFGGTCREAVAAQRLPPDEARHVVCIEMNRVYLDAVRGSFELDTTPRVAGQVGLFQ